MRNNSSLVLAIVLHNRDYIYTYKYDFYKAKQKFWIFPLIWNTCNITFGGKNRKFYEHGIMALPERRQKVIDKIGQYLIEYLKLYF